MRHNPALVTNRFAAICRLAIWVECASLALGESSVQDKYHCLAYLVLAVVSVWVKWRFALYLLIVPHRLVKDVFFLFLMPLIRKLSIGFGVQSTGLSAFITRDCQTMLSHCSSPSLAYRRLSVRPELGKAHGVAQLHRTIGDVGIQIDPASHADRIPADKPSHLRVIVACR